MGQFIPLVGFKTQLEKTLAVKDNVLPVSESDMAYLSAKLGKNGYTYLMVKSCVAHEIVKVTGVESGVVMIERAQEETKAIVAKYDSCVMFEWTVKALGDFVAQGAGGAKAPVSSIQSANECLTITNHDGEVSVEKPEQEEIVWRSGNKQYTQNKCGVVSSEPVEAGQALADGEYKNATIMVKDGQIVAIKSGTNIVYSGGGCCSCSGKAEQ